MRAAAIPVRRVMPGVMALLLVVAGEAAAQAYPPSAIRALDQEREMDLQALDAFGERRADSLRSSERPGTWTLYGRFGVVNFQDRLAPEGSDALFTWRRTGPGLGARIYVGVRRRF